MPPRPIWFSAHRFLDAAALALLLLLLLLLLLPLLLLLLLLLLFLPLLALWVYFTVKSVFLDVLEP